MDNIERFMKHEIGIDVLNSSEEALKELSDIIMKKYVGFIEAGKCAVLFDYYLYLKSDSIDNPWSVLVYELKIRCFNAYRGWSRSNFLKKHDILTADEIINYKPPAIEVTENEIGELLCSM